MCDCNVLVYALNSYIGTKFNSNDLESMEPIKRLTSAMIPVQTATGVIVSDRMSVNVGFADKMHDLLDLTLLPALERIWFQQLALLCYHEGVEEVLDSQTKPLRFAAVIDDMLIAELVS